MKLTKEVVEKLLTKFPKDKVYCKAFYQDTTQVLTCSGNYYSDKYVDWLVGRELLYCEFTKDYCKIVANNLSEKQYIKLFLTLEEKWSKVGLLWGSSYNLEDLVCRLVESRGD